MMGGRPKPYTVANPWDQQLMRALLDPTPGGLIPMNNQQFDMLMGVQVHHPSAMAQMVQMRSAEQQLMLSQALQNTRPCEPTISEEPTDENIARQEALVRKLRKEQGV